MAKKTAAQLNREIKEALASPRTSRRARTQRSHAAVRGARAHATVRARKLGSIGDVNPIDYGGGYIFSAPESGGPHLEYFEGLDTDERAERLAYADDADEKIDKLQIQIYRVDLGKDAKDFLSDYDWVNWEGVASSTGQDSSEYTTPGKLRTAQQRALAIQDAAGYHGWHEFDQYPLQITVGELKQRWGK
jgi:hypothetical protein